MVINMPTELGRQMDENSEIFNKEWKIYSPWISPGQNTSVDTPSLL